MGKNKKKQNNYQNLHATANSNKTANNSSHKQHYTRRSPGSSQPKADSKELRPVFAAYLNMARANLFVVLRHISVLNGLSVENKDEEHMEKMAVARFANQKPEVSQKVFTLLFKYIPCLKQMSQAYVTKAKTARDGKQEIKEHKAVTHADLQELLQHIIHVLNFQRNDFTHAAHYNKPDERAAEFKDESSLFRPINTAFMGSKRETARIFKYTAKDMFFVDQGERMERTSEKNESGKPIYREYEDWYFRLFSKSPKYIRNDQGELELFTEDASAEQESLQLTTAGLTFLICKLLHKKFASQLAQQSGLFRDKTQRGYSPFSKRENEVMFNIFCAHRIRLPKGRIESIADSSALGLDMLNELQKCPKELFDTFSDKDRKLFQIARKNDSEMPLADDDINLFCRIKDRFAPLALKYIDAFRSDQTEQSETFCSPLPNIVFQIALGKYRYKFYTRASLDTDEEDRVRVLQKEINGFGPIFKIEELRDGKKDENETDDKEKQSEVSYSSLIRRVSTDQNQLYDPDTATTKPYLTDHHASYAITGDRIGLMWGTTKEEGILDPKTLCYLPNLPLPTKNEKDEWTVDRNSIQENVPPRAWLSIHDLPALLFLHHLGGKPEEVIKSKYKSLKKLFTDIAQGKLEPLFKGSLESREKQRKKQLEDLKAKLNTLLMEKYKGLEIKDIPCKLVEYLTLGAFAGRPSADVQFVEWASNQLTGYPEKRDNNGRIIIRPFKGIIQSLEDRINKFSQDLNTVGDKQNRLGRKAYVDIRPGSLARYLSKDIVGMTLPDEYKSNGGKPTGLDFAVLQSSIATFVGNGKKLKDTPMGKMLQEAIIVSNHPFLNNLMNLQMCDTINLYQKYQNEKLKWLKERAKAKDFLKNKFFMYYMREAYRNFTASTADKIKSIHENNTNKKGLAERYLDTLQLPNGLFTEAIRKQLASNDDTRDNPYIKAALSDDKYGHSASYLLNVYFTHVLNDMSQPFYRNLGEQYKRHYKLLDTLYPCTGGETYLVEADLCEKLRKDSNGIVPIRQTMDEHIDNLQMIVCKQYDPAKGKKVPIYGPADEKTKEEERTKVMHQLRDLQRNEQIIRRYRNEDMLLFLMAKKLLLAGGQTFQKDNSETGGLQHFRLQDIMPPAYKDDNTKSILEQPIDFSLTIGLNDEKGNPINDAEGKQQRRTIQQKGLKLKNYGDFFAFLYDSRIGSLLSQLPIPTDNVIDRTNLEKELDSYDRKRLKVFAVLQAIEHKIIKDHPELTDSNAGGQGFCDTDGKPYRNSFSGLLSLCKQYLATENKINDLGYSIVDIRNAFSHNRYTSNDNKKIDISTMSLPQVAELILKWLENHK